MANIIDKIRAKGEELATVRLEINTAEEAFEISIRAAKERRDIVQAELLELLRDNDLASIKTSSGDNFIRAKRKGFAFDEYKLLPWCTERGLTKIDTARLKQVLTKADELPEGVTMVEQEYISVRSAKKAESPDAVAE